MIKIIGIVLVLMLACSNVYGDMAIGVKVSPATLYEQRGDSPYAGNTVCDTEEAIGFYVKWMRDTFVARLDYTRHETGNTLQNSIAPIPYEEIDVTQQDVMLYVGKEWNNGLYLLGGAGIVFNDLYIEGYAANPFTYETKNSLAHSVIVGFNRELHQDWRWFVEGRYIWNSMDVDLEYLLTPASVNVTEDMDNGGVFFGLEYRF